MNYVEHQLRVLHVGVAFIKSWPMRQNFGLAKDCEASLSHAKETSL